MGVVQLTRLFLTLGLCLVTPARGQKPAAGGTGLNPNALEIELPDGVGIAAALAAVNPITTTTTTTTTTAAPSAAKAAGAGAGGAGAAGGAGGAGKAPNVLDALSTLLGLGTGGGNAVKAAVIGNALQEIVEVDGVPNARGQGRSRSQTVPRHRLPDYEKEVEFVPALGGGLRSVVDVEGGRKRARRPGRRHYGRGDPPDGPDGWNPRQRLNPRHRQFTDAPDGPDGWNPRQRLNPRYRQFTDAPDPPDGPDGWYPRRRRVRIG